MNISIQNNSNWFHLKSYCKNLLLLTLYNSFANNLNTKITNLISPHSKLFSSYILPEIKLYTDLTITNYICKSIIHKEIKGDTIETQEDLDSFLQQLTSYKEDFSNIKIVVKHPETSNSSWISLKEFSLISATRKVIFLAFDTIFSFTKDVSDAFDDSVQNVIDNAQAPLKESYLDYRIKTAIDNINPSSSILSFKTVTTDPKELNFNFLFKNSIDNMIGKVSEDDDQDLINNLVIYKIKLECAKMLIQSTLASTTTLAIKTIQRYLNKDKEYIIKSQEDLDQFMESISLADFTEQVSGDIAEDFNVDIPA